MSVQHSVTIYIMMILFNTTTQKESYPLYIYLEKSHKIESLKKYWSKTANNLSFRKRKSRTILAISVMNI